MSFPSTRFKEGDRVRVVGGFAAGREYRGRTGTVLRESHIVNGEWRVSLDVAPHRRPDSVIIFGGMLQLINGLDIMLDLLP